MDIRNWVSELKTALTLETGHLSLYQLSIERGTPFYSAHRNGAFTIPGEELAHDLYKITNELMESAGYCAYEVSNYEIGRASCRERV